MHLIAPDFRVASVLDLPASRLAEWGRRVLLVDVDCTLKRYCEEFVGPEAAGWLTELRAAGIRVCLISNGLKERIAPVAGRLGLPFVARACKPLPLGCRRALRLLAARPGEAALVGDQLFADVMAARLAGLMSILVEPIHPEEEPWFTRAKRPLERCFLRRLPL